MLKRNYFYNLFIFLVINGYSQCTWQVMGSDEKNEVVFGNGSSGTEEKQNMAVSYDGTPYVVYAEYISKLSVRKFDGVNWVQVGARRFSGGTINGIITVDSAGTPYVAYRDSTQGNYLTVMKYDGVNWVTLGAAGFNGEKVNYYVIGVTRNGSLYIAYEDLSINNPKIKVWNFNGAAWVSLGTVGVGENVWNRYTSLTVDRWGTPYVAYWDSLSPSNCTVKKYNGTNWVLVGPLGFSGGNAGIFNICTDYAGTPYVCYRQVNSIIVEKFNGANWVQVGPAIGTPGTNYVHFAVDSAGVPSIIYSNAGRLTVSKFNGISWTNIGPSAFNENAVNPFIVLVGSGKPYIIFQAGNEIVPVSPMQFDGINWVKIGPPRNTQHDVGSRSIAVGKGDTAYMCAWRHDSLYNLKYNGSSWVPVGPYPYPIKKPLGGIVKINKLGEPYCFYVDSAFGGNVMKYNGSSWVPVGATPFIPYIYLGDYSLTFDSNNTPYVIYLDNNAEANVKKFNGANWVQVGAPGFSANIIHSLDEVDLVISPLGVPIAVVSYYLASSLWVYSFNGSSWNVGVNDIINVGSYGYFAVCESDTGIFGSTYIAYSGPNAYIHVLKSTQTGWDSIGPSMGKGFIGQGSMTVDSSGTPYVSFGSIDSSYHDVLLKKYVGGSWIGVGTSVFKDDQILADAAVVLNSKNIPYVAYNSPTFHVRQLIDSGLVVFSPQPAPLTMCENSTATLSASVGDPNATYQWQVSSGSGFSNMYNGIIYSGVYTPTLSINGALANMNNYKYRCTAFASCSKLAYSDTVALTVKPAPAVSISSSASVICLGDSFNVTASGATTYTWMPGNLNNPSTTFFPSSSSVYTVTGTGVNNCTRSVTTSVTVNSLPIVNAAATYTLMCPGDTTNLSATGANSYTWMPGNMNVPSVTVSPTTTTVYTVTGINSNSCINTATVNIQVNNFSLPNVTTSAASNPICFGTNTNISAGGANTYTWSPGGLTGGSISVSPNSTATYTVIGTDVNGCYNSSTIVINVNPLPTVSITPTSPSICIGFSDTLQASGALTFTWNTSVNTQSITVSPTSSTIYTVSGTDANGCVNTYSINLVVNPLPNISASTTGSGICLGANTSVHAIGASTYTWMPGNFNGANVNVSPTVNTNYIVTGTDGNGCVNTASTSVTVFSLPNVTLNLGFSNPLCKNAGPQALTGGSPAGGGYGGPGISGNFFYPNNVGAGVFGIDYTYTDSHNCTVTATDSVHVVICVGIEQFNAGNNFSIFPNPSNGVFEITSSVENTSLEILNSLGELVLLKNIKNNDVIDLTGQNDGVYNIRLLNEFNQTIYKTIFVKHTSN